MDLLKTPSVQSLLDSDLESIESFQSLDIEELDEVEYALPASEAPTLAEALSAEDEDLAGARTDPWRPTQPLQEPSTCSALQVKFLQAVSQQLIQAQERSLAGAATTLSVGKDGRLTVGTAHGHLLSFQDQTLRWVCNSNADKGAVSCLAYNQDGSRLLAGYARGLICQYESIKGLILRRVMLGCEIWGTLKVTWAGTSGLVLDTGGSVWLVKFSRPLGVRSARTSCLFSGARGEVVAMTARDARILAMATLSRVIIVAGGRASGLRLGGPPDTLPVLEWSESDERVLICARATLLQWLVVEVTGAALGLRPLRRCELKVTPLWLGWVGGTLAIFDADENLRLWGDDYDKPLDLSHIEPVYASAFFKGVWTEGLVSRAMSAAGASALGGACATQGQLALLGRQGVLRVRLRDQVARAQAFLSSRRYAQGLRLLCAAKGPEAQTLAERFVANLAHTPHTLDEKQVADLTVKICLKFEMSEELWGSLWEGCSKQPAFVEALGDAIVRGELAEVPPSPDYTQALIERLAELEPSLVERVIASLPLTSLDPHRLSVFARQRRLWRALGAVTAALSGGSGAMRELVPWVEQACARDGQCSCAGGALLVAAADALAGRGAGGRALPTHARPSARHDALRALLNDETNNTGTVSPLEALVRHDARAAMRLLEQCARDAPFAGPLAKANRRRVARALLHIAPTLHEADDRVEIVEFVAGQLSVGALPLDADVVSGCQALAASARCERADRAYLNTLTRAKNTNQQLEEAMVTAADRPRVLFRLNVLLNQHQEAIQQFLLIQSPSIADKNELFEYLQTRIQHDDGKDILIRNLPKIIELGPRSTAALLSDYVPDAIAGALQSSNSDQALEFAEHLLECGNLKGDAAAAHLRNLCSVRASEVSSFLANNPGVVRPEQALAIVQQAGAAVADAEPRCLEAAGDVDGALDALLRHAHHAQDTGDAETEARACGAACSLCGRAAAGSPRPVAAARWARVLARARALPPAALLDALNYVPLDQLIDKLHSTRMALTILECAAHERRVWAGCARLTGREAHAALSRALRAARRGVSCRGPCAACRRPLASLPPVRSSHCARAFHASCPAETTCVCGRKAPPAPPPAAPRPARSLTPPPMAFALQLAAPPRPDLEGIV